MKPIGRIIQPNLFPEVLPTVNTARPEFQWLIPYDEACKLPAGTLLYMDDQAIEERKYHDLMQRVGTAMDLQPGTNLLSELLPRTHWLLSRSRHTQAERDDLFRCLNVFWSLPWYKRVWRALLGQW